MVRIVFVKDDIEQNICNKDTNYNVFNNNDITKIKFENIYEEMLKITKKEDDIKINRKILRKRDGLWYNY
jgi:hypothetical protein